jgi:transient receptor potential cation channel subfamily C protein 4
MTTLFWALFGLTQLNAVRDGPMQEFTKRVGEHLLMVYHAMAIIVLINMLIAMMSNSFQNIEVNARSTQAAIEMQQICSSFFSTSIASV